MIAISKDRMDTEVFKGLLTEYSKEKVDEFLSHYSSKGVYVSAISHMLYNLGKDDIEALTIKDYWAALNFKEDIKSSYDIYISSFFKYLYAFEILTCGEGFGDKLYWDKEKIKAHFQRLKENPEEKIKEYYPHIPIQVIDKVENLLSIVSEEKEMFKISFVWYMLFHNGLEVYELAKSSSTNYNNGILISDKGNSFTIPNKFHSFLEALKTKNNNKFNFVHDVVNRLSELIEYPMTPKNITLARKENLFKCPECGVELLNLSENFRVVNGRIICSLCIEELKKNYKLDFGEIPSESIEFEEDIKEKTELSAIIYTFKDLKEKIKREIKEIDYLKLHKFLMEIGKLGEAYIYDREREKLLSKGWEDRVDKSFSRDHNCGFDILSYDEVGNKLFIEVKTTAKEKDDFYITARELEKAEEVENKGLGKYLIYRVYNVLAENESDIRCEIISDILHTQDYDKCDVVYKYKKKF